MSDFVPFEIPEEEMDGETIQVFDPDPDQQLAQEPHQQPAQEPDEQPVQESSHQAAQEPSPEPSHDPYQDPSRQRARQLAQELAQERAQRLAQRLAQQRAQQRAQEHIQTSSTSKRGPPSDDEGSPTSSSRQRTRKKPRTDEFRIPGLTLAYGDPPPQQQVKESCQESTQHPAQQTSVSKRGPPSDDDDFPGGRSEQRASKKSRTNEAQIPGLNESRIPGLNEFRNPEPNEFRIPGLNEAYRLRPDGFTRGEKSYMEQMVAPMDYSEASRLEYERRYQEGERDPESESEKVNQSSDISLFKKSANTPSQDTRTQSLTNIKYPTTQVSAEGSNQRVRAGLTDYNGHVHEVESYSGCQSPKVEKPLTQAQILAGLEEYIGRIQNKGSYSALSSEDIERPRVSPFTPAGADGATAPFQANQPSLIGEMADAGTVGTGAVGNVGAASANDSAEPIINAAEARDQMAEWQDDTSDESSDSSESSLTYLTYKEQLKLLENEDDETDGPPPRTANEVTDKFIHKPDFVFTPTTKVSSLGVVRDVVHNTLVIKANDSKVLDRGTVVCLADNTVIGVIADTIGQVNSPIYIVHFDKDEEITDFNIVAGTKIHYVEDNSKLVNSDTLRLVKGSDASNVFDEEVRLEDQEFSDDEAEAEFKKKQKALKITSLTKDAPASNSGPLQLQVSAKKISSVHVDEDSVDDMYTPLARPDGIANERNEGLMYSALARPANLPIDAVMYTPVTQPAQVVNSGVDANPPNSLEQGNDQSNTTLPRNAKPNKKKNKRGAKHPSNKQRPQLKDLRNPDTGGPARVHQDGVKGQPYHSRKQGQGSREGQRFHPYGRQTPHDQSNRADQHGFPDQRKRKPKPKPNQQAIHQTSGNRMQTFDIGPQHGANNTQFPPNPNLNPTQNQYPYQYPYQNQYQNQYKSRGMSNSFPTTASSGDWINTSQQTSHVLPDQQSSFARHITPYGANQAHAGYGYQLQAQQLAQLAPSTSEHPQFSGRSQAPGVTQNPAYSLFTPPQQYAGEQAQAPVSSGGPYASYGATDPSHALRSWKSASHANALAPGSHVPPSYSQDIHHASDQPVQQTAQLRSGSHGYHPTFPLMEQALYPNNFSSSGSQLEQEPADAGNHKPKENEYDPWNPYIYRK